MADVAVQNPATGEMRMVAEEDAPSFTQQTGWTVADQTQRERGARILESGGAGDQALAGVETAVRTATLGAVPGLAGGWKQRAEVQAEEHPYVRMAATGVGALAPALATGGVAGAAAGGLGLSGAAATALTAGAEGLAGGYAQEVEDARSEMRDVSAGNVLLYGLGGEVVGRALPAAFKMGAGQVRRALTAAEEIAGEGVPSAFAGVESRSVESQARGARDLPQGPERAAALGRTAPQQYERLATEGAETAEKLTESAEALSGSSERVAERIRQTLPEESPAQQNFFTEQKAGLAKTVDESIGARELGEHGKDLRNAIRPALRQMDEAETIADQYLAARDLAGKLDGVADRLSKDPEVLERARAPKAPPAPNEMEQAAIDYAGDAARRRLRGVAEHTGDEELSALAGPQAERSARAQALPDNVKLAINQKTGSASLDDVKAWARDPEALRAGHGLSEMSGANVEPGGGTEALIGRIRDRAKALRQGLTDESLFGGAARLESDLSRGQAKLAAGLEDAKALANPKKMRKFLETDRAERGALASRLDDTLDGAEELLATHEAHGTLDPKQIAEARAQIGKLRETRAFADEVQVAKAERPGSLSGPGQKKGGGWGEIAWKTADEVMEFQPSYTARKLYKFAKRVKAINDAGRSATRQTARKLAGVGAESPGLFSSIGRAAKGAAKEEIAAAADRVVPGASKAYQKASDLLERSRARTGTEGAVVIAGEAHPKIDKIATKLKDRLGKLDELEDKTVVGAEDEFGSNPAADRHGERLDRARSQVEESLHDLHGEYESRLAETLDGRTPEELGPKARAKYDRLAAGREELNQVFAQHGGGPESVDLGGGKTVESLRVENPREAARDWLKGRQTVDTEAGYARTGLSVKDIATSPIGMTAALGTAALAAPKVVSALDRFTGDYSGPEESFAAKRKLLDQDVVSPDTLFEALGASLDDLPKVSPELFQQLSARVADNIRYVRANLPPGIQTTMMYPNGTPVSMSAMREFATLYNTTFDPHSVLEDIKTGTASTLQMKTLREAHPDIYEQLRGDVVEEIGQNFRNVPLSTKLQLDILFEADGLAGPFFSSKAADMIGQGLKDDQKRGPSAQQMGDPGDTASSAGGPAGLNAIQSSVTNKAA